MSDDTRACLNCGTAGIINARPNKAFGGTVAVFTCPRCDRLQCSRCSAYIGDPFAKFCPNCRREIPPLKPGSFA